MRIPVSFVILWTIEWSLCLATLAALFRRGTLRERPGFTFFLALNAGIDVLQFAAIQINYTVYFYTYWFTILAFYASQYVLLYETVSSLLRSYPNGKKHFAGYFTTTAASAALVSVALAVSMNVSIPQRLSALLVGLERTSAMAWCGVFAGCIISARRAGLGWDKFTYRIACGAVIRNTAALAAAMLASVRQFHFESFVDRAELIGTCFAFSLWFVAAIQSRRQTPRTEKENDLALVSEGVRASGISGIGLQI